MADPIPSESKLVYWTKLLAAFTLVLALTSAVSNVFTWLDFSEKRSTADLTADLLRPVMHVDGVNLAYARDVKSGNPIVAFNVVERNVGSTRAVDAKGWVSVKYYPGAISDNVDFSKPDGKISPSSTLVASNAQLFLDPVALSFDDVRGAVAGSGFIVIWGSTTYHSIYKPDNDLTMSFCTTVQIAEGAKAVSAPPDTPETEIARFAIKASPTRADCNKNS